MAGKWKPASRYYDATSSVERVAAIRVSGLYAMMDVADR